MSKGSARLGICSILLAILALAGCEVTDVPEGGPLNVSFKVEKDSYNIGSTVKTVLKNESAQPILYNLCTSKLEYKMDGKWQPLNLDSVCPNSNKSLEPGDTTSHFIDLNSSLQLSEGVYRIKTNVKVKKQETLTTPPFEIRTTVL